MVIKTLDIAVTVVPKHPSSPGDAWFIYSYWPGEPINNSYLDDAGGNITLPKPPFNTDDVQIQFHLQTAQFTRNNVTYALSFKPVDTGKPEEILAIHKEGSPSTGLPSMFRGLGIDSKNEVVSVISTNKDQQNYKYALAITGVPMGVPGGIPIKLVHDPKIRNGGGNTFVASYDFWPIAITSICALFLGAAAYRIGKRIARRSN